MNRKFNLCIIIAIILLFTVLSVKSLAGEVPSISVGGEDFKAIDEVQTNSKSTATYNYKENTLTLNNYDGGFIYYYDEEPLTIILKGENKITCEYYSDNGIETETAGLTIEGDGSIVLQDVRNGIVVDKGNLIVNDAAIYINNLFGNGITTWDGNVTINGSIFMDDDLAKKEEEMGFAPNYNAINVEGGDIVINGDVSVKNAGKALLTDKKVIIKSGKVNIVTFNSAIDSLEGFEIEDGDVSVEVAESDGMFFDLIYGIKSEGAVNIKGGTLYIKVPENSITIAVINDEPEFEISEDLVMDPENCRLQTVTFEDMMFGWEKTAKIIGLEEATIEIEDDEYVITNGVSEVTIKEEVVYTYEVIKGDEQSFTEKKVGTYGFTIDGDFSLFKELIIEGLELEKDIDYTVKEGSTIIEFTEKGIEKINTLEAGAYEVKVNYTNNTTVISKLIIEEDDSEEEETEEEKQTEEEPIEEIEEEQKEEIINEETEDEKIEKEEPKVEEQTNNPKTGDKIYYTIGILLISIIGAIITRKKLM